MTSSDPHIPLNSPDIIAERLTALNELFPEAFTEGILDVEKLATLVSQDPKPLVERYGLSWAGKNDALRSIKAPTDATLRPQRDQSVQFDDTRNLIIEGDNLEVLKLLQRSYHKKIKMIYIDPPYNTGNEFIYPDDFREGLEAYLEYTQQVKDGVRQTTNAETNGRYHSNWLSMMYPRLFLARNLLRDDGVIFVSIDDNEVHNLRLLMNEVFGEENFLTIFYIQVRYEDKTLVQDSDFHKIIENVLVYRKSSQAQLNKQSEQYSLDKFVWTIQVANEPESITTIDGKRVEIYTRDQYEVKEVPPSLEGLKEIWATGKILDGNSSGRFFRDYLTGRFEEDGYGILYKVYGIGDDKNDFRYFTGPNKKGATKGKYYQGVPSKVVDSLEDTITFQPIGNFYNFADAFGNCRHEGGIDFRNGKKPIAFLRMLLNLGLSSLQKDDIILDFFAGSGTTAHAVMELNREDGGQRRFILVQLPETTENSDYPSIADLTRERVRRAAHKLNDPQSNIFDSDESSQDRGFKAFTLDASNLKRWDGTITDAEMLAQQLTFHIDHRVEGRSDEDMLYEIVLKAGMELTVPIVERRINDQTVYDVNDKTTLICLAVPIHDTTLRAMIDLQPQQIICLDSGFTGNDAIKTNIVLQMRDAGISFRTV